MAIKQLTRKKDGLGLWSLTGLVVGSMIGAGIFNLVQGTAEAAGPLATIIAWLITGVGMIFLILSFRNLTIKKPKLNAGVYSYAEAGFGKYVGFNSAWGYWISAWIGNIAYAVAVFSALGYFFPDLFGKGQNWASVVGMSVLLWSVHLLILKGVKTASFINALVTAAKLIPLAIFLLAIFLSFKVGLFNQDLWGLAGNNFDMGAVIEQVKNMMLVTVWVFIGIEGAVVFSGHAKKRSDIIKATLIGFSGVLSIYVLMTVLAFGVATQKDLAALDSPAMSMLLERLVGPWGAWLVNIGLMIAVLGGWLAWTMFAAELPYQAAKNKTFPSIFAKENKVGAPVVSLLVTNILVQIFLLTIPGTEGSAYNIGISIATSAILIPYALTAFYQLKVSLQEKKTVKYRAFNIFVGVMASVYAVWLVYAAGMQYLLITVFLYAPGMLVYVLMQIKNRKKIFTLYELLLAVVVIALFAYAVQQLLAGALDETLGIKIADLIGQ